ncbi:MAG: hypothetical protein JNJ40_19540 [Bacteroidia bacterium]|nr:hypothetical protein [Bacteroidia bacterium]
MKKSLLALSIITLALFSCKKDKETSDFTATDVTGISVVKGNVNKNVVTPNGNGGWINTSRVNMSGIVVTIKVNKGGSQGLYPNSTANGADVYSATTDANGNYAISVKSNATGVSALITIDGFTGTQDTIINGVTKTGLYATYAGTSVTRNLFMGQNTTFDHNFTAANVSSNPNTITIGSAIVTGSINMNLVRKVTTGTVVAFSTTNIAVPANTPVYLSFDKDPTLLNAKMYQTTTSANGSYTFNLSTVPVGTSGFNQDATIWVADWATSRDTMNFNGTNFINITPGVQGVYNKATTTTNGVYSTEIRNAINLGYGAFVPN